MLYKRVFRSPSNNISHQKQLCEISHWQSFARVAVEKHTAKTFYTRHKYKSLLLLSRYLSRYILLILRKIVCIKIIIIFFKIIITFFLNLHNINRIKYKYIFLWCFIKCTRKKDLKY